MPMPYGRHNKRTGPGSHAQWAFGAGKKAMTWVSQTGEETVAEHGLSYYTATKSLGVTPGHAANIDLVYQTFHPTESALRCFRCHSTGPVTSAPPPSKYSQVTGSSLRILSWSRPRSRRAAGARIDSESPAGLQQSRLVLFVELPSSGKRLR